MSRKWKIIIGIFLFIFTLGIGLSIFVTLFSWNKIKTIQTQLDKKNNDSTNQENPNPNKPDSTNPLPDIKDDKDESLGNIDDTVNGSNNQNKDDNSTPSLPSTPELGPSDSDSSNKPNQTPTKPNPQPPSNDTNSNNKPSTPELDKNESITNPVPPSQPQPPINSDSNSLEMQKSLMQYLDKYEFLKNTTQYQDYFLSVNRLIFNEVKIRNNTYQLIRNAILKTNTYNDKTMSLKIQVKYQLNKNNKSIRLWIKWSTKLKDIGFNVIKNYYDKIIITLS